MRRELTLAMAFIGVVIGAGFASGQEIMQYYVSFGAVGILGAALAGIVMTVCVVVTFQFGSYLLANEHSEVLDTLSSRSLACFLDYFLSFAMFATGFVMFAGAGANLNQQWGLPTWVGSTLMLALVLGVGMLNVDRVTRVIGLLTPAIIVMLALVYVVVLKDPWPSLDSLNTVAATLTPALPHWGLSAINYAGLTLTTALSMTVIMAGTQVNMKATRRTGYIGGATFSLMLLLSTVTLFRRVQTVGHADMPLLSIVNDINSVAGNIMSVVIYGMIFNTAMSLFFGIGKRLSTDKPESFRPRFIAITLAGFTLSFVGFKSLVGYVYPALGFVGVVLIVSLLAVWWRMRKKIARETKRREIITELAEKKFDPEEVFTASEQRKLDRVIEKSVVDDDALREAIIDDVPYDTEDFDVEDWQDIEATNPDPRVSPSPAASPTLAPQLGKHS